MRYICKALILKFTNYCILIYFLRVSELNKMSSKYFNCSNKYPLIIQKIISWENKIYWTGEMKRFFFEKFKRLLYHQGLEKPQTKAEFLLHEVSESSKR